MIDASTAFRVAEGWAYGMAEMSEAHRAQIAASSRVANPGCYPQGLIALVRPLIDAGIMSADYPVTYNAVSGYSGGGKKMIEYYEADGATAIPYLPYGLTFAHKHLPEMQRLRRAGACAGVPARGRQLCPGHAGRGSCVLRTSRQARHR